MFPLQGDTHAEQEISLLEGALQAGTLHLEEPHEAGSVPELRVVNEGSLRVLILEGDKLIGAKQNRVVNSSVLVAAGSDLTLPVSCIERGRWSYRSRAFSPGTGSPHLALRRLETRSVHDSLRYGRGRRSDQSAVWKEVRRKARLHAAASRSPLSERLDAFEQLTLLLAACRRREVVAFGARIV